MLQRKKRIPTIKEVTTPINGIFSEMVYDFELVTKEQLDLLFFTSYGERTISPLFDYYISYNDSDNSFSLSEEKKKEISNLILSFYKTNWERLKDVVKTEYDPIHNFSDEVVETISDTDEKTSTTNDSVEDTGTSTKTRTDNLNSNETRNLSGSQNDDTTYQMQGFNSTSFQNKDKDSLARQTTDTGTVAVANTGTQKNVEERDFSTVKQGSENTSNNYNRKRSMSRIGNIGNITTQKMLHEEIELWKWNFIEQILNDAKSMLTLAIYSS